MNMRVMCGGEEGVKGVYAGEIIDLLDGYENKLIRVDAIVCYPVQRSIITKQIFERLPLPYGAVVRLQVIGPFKGRAAKSAREYNDMVEFALHERMHLVRKVGDLEELKVLEGRYGRRKTGIDGSYARK